MSNENESETPNNEKTKKLKAEEVLENFSWKIPPDRIVDIYNRLKETLKDDKEYYFIHLGDLSTTIDEKEYDELYALAHSGRIDENSFREYCARKTKNQLKKQKRNTKD